ncbi:hypothetical protein BX600DRAFT_428808 [Xylariales sp. PMI_506]|nr:hypothetical protein BX600DRAFT_428808 [Xylariales sp. PMI_506]
MGLAERMRFPRRGVLWRVIVVPLAMLSLVISGVALLHHRSDLESHGVRAPGSWKRSLDGWVNSETARAIENDELVQSRVASVVYFSAGTAEWLSKRYASGEMARISQLLQDYAQTIPATRAEEGSDLMSRAATNPFAAPFDALLSAFGDATGAAAGSSGGDLLSSLGSVVSGGLGSIGSSLLGDLAGAGMFLGVGIGQGTASGLNLTSAANAKVVAAKVVSASGMNATGLNPAIQNLGSGLSSTLAGSVNISSLLPSAGALVPAVMGLATGIGDGVVSGLKVNNVAPAAVTSASSNATSTNTTSPSVGDILSTFGFGLTDTIASNINVQQLTSGAMSQQLMAQLPSVAQGLAVGLGTGAITGLKVNTITPPNSSAVPDVANNFGFGLSQSVASNVNISMFTGNINTAMLMQYLPAAAAGLGRGLGEGVPVGLGVQPDPGTIPMQPMSNGTLDISSITQNFGVGLTSGVLQNGTLSKVMSSVNLSAVGSSALGNVDVGKAAEGFARGFVQGASDGIAAMGGVNALFSGKTVSPNVTIVDTPINFNDSVNGAAVGFGQGFASQGIMVANTLINSASTPARKRGVSVRYPSRTTAIVVKRQTNATDTSAASITSGLNLSSLLTTGNIAGAIQMVINVLTCTGIGGLLQVALGLSKSGAISTNATSTLDLSSLESMLPNGTVHFTSDGNNFDIDLQQVVANLNSSILTAAQGISVNGTKVIPFAVFLVVHILIAIIAMLNVLPLVIGLESARNIIVRLGKPHNLTWVPKWVDIAWFGVIGPSMAIIVIFGVLVAGNSGHFRTAHGIIGLLTAIDGFAAVGLHYAAKLFGAPPGEPSTLVQKVRVVNNQIFPVAVTAATFSGFSDLSSISLCVPNVIPFELALSVGFGLSSLFIVGTSVSQLEIYLKRRAAKKLKKLAKENIAVDTKSKFDTSG